MDLFYRKFFILLGDLILLYIALGLTLVIGFWGEAQTPLFISHAVPFSFLYILWLIIFYVLDLYDLSLPPSSARFLARYISALCLLFVVGVLFFYVLALNDLTPKTNLLIHVVIFGSFAYLWRIIFSTKISSLVPWRIGLCGLGEEGLELRNIIESFKHQGYECFSLTLDNLEEQIKRLRLHVIVLPLSSFSNTSGFEALYDCLGTGSTFLDLSEGYELFARKIPLSTIDHRWFVRNIQERERGLYHRAKRLMDVIAACAILFVTSPLWILIALAIKLEDRGTVFYSQERIGKNRAIFSIRKFRTMRIDAEAQGAQWALKEDPRVTRVGRVLRATHLDELPQMVNVLKGDISFVGPRPERPVFVSQLEREIPHYHVRHLIKPGFTGWAQIKFRYARSVLDSQHKFEYDLYYIKNRSIILDVLIFLKTVQLLFRRGQ